MEAMPDTSDLDLLKSLATVQTLPTLRAVVNHLLAALDSEDVDLAHVSHLISQDPAVTGQILRISNSIFYNASGMSTTSIHDAVSRIGCAQVRNLVVSLGVLDAFPDAQAGFDYPAFWRHSFTTALAAGQVAAQSPMVTVRGRARDNPYFLAGLLHDIGTLLLCHGLGEEYLEILETGKREGRPLQGVESERLGFDHQDVGAALIRRWGLPIEVAAAAEFHHRVQEAPDDSTDYVLVVHAANLLGTGRGLPSHDEPDGGEPLELDALGIDEERLPGLVESVEQAAADSELLLLVARGG